MMDFSKYQGIFPAFYACYDDEGAISPERVRAFTEYLIGKGVKGLYVGGSSGECIYQSVAERKLLLENVMAAAEGRITIIAHVACNNTADSRALAAHAESLGVDAIAAIPPIYFHLPPYGIAKYWNDISAAAPNTDFIIYNIPQLAGVALSSALLREMLKNPRVIGVKNSSMPVQDIEMWRDEGALVFNGPDEQLLSGLAAGAIGGIGGTYAAMPEGHLPAFRAGRDRQSPRDPGRLLPYDLQDVRLQGQYVRRHQGHPARARRAGHRRRARAAVRAAAGGSPRGGGHGCRDHRAGGEIPLRRSEQYNWPAFAGQLF